MDDTSDRWELTPTFAWRTEVFRGSLLGLAIVAVLLAFQRFDANFELIDDDAISSWQPIFTDFARQVGEGRVPVWSHHTSCGYPLLGWPQPSFTYPPMWIAHGLCRLIGFEAGELYVVTLFHAFLAAAASFVYLRRFDVHPLAATTASLSVPLSGVMLGLGSCWPTYFFTAACWPLMFLALEELRRRPTWVWTLFLGLLGGMAFLFLDLMVMAKFALFGGLYFMLRIERSTLLRNLRALLVASAIALLIGLGQLAPSIEIIATSERAAMGSNDFYAVPPRLWLGLLYPFWQLPWERFDFSATRAAGGFFVGPCAVLGAMFAAKWYWPLRGPHRALLVLTALYLSFALGSAWPPNEIMQKLPVFSSIRWPFRWMFEASCALALLSGFGLHLAIRDLSKGQGRWLLIAFAVVTTLTIVVMPWMPLKLLVVSHTPAPSDLERVHVVTSAFWLVGLAALWWFKNSTTAFLSIACGWTAVALVVNIPVAQQTRMARMTRLLDDPLTVNGDPQERVFFVARHSDVLFANKEGNFARSFPHRFGTRTVLGYVYRPPSQAWMTGFELDGSIYEKEDDIARRFLGPKTSILSTLRVGHVVVFKGNKPLVAGCEANPNLKLERETPFYLVYRNDGFKEPAFLVRELTPERGRDDLVEMGIRTRMPEAALVDPAYDGPMKFSGAGTVTNFREHHGRISFDVDAADEAFVVVTTTFFPRWRATIDGESATLVRVNGSFMGLRVPAGRHDVRLEYWPVDHLAYLAASAVALVVATGCWLWLLRRDRPV